MNRDIKFLEDYDEVVSLIKSKGLSPCFVLLAIKEKLNERWDHQNDYNAWKLSERVKK